MALRFSLTAPVNSPAIASGRNRLPPKTTNTVLNFNFSPVSIPHLKSTPSSFNSTSISAKLSRSNHHRQPRSTTITCLFTGIVEEIGEVKRLGTTADGSGYDLKIRAKTVLGGVNLGDSIAVNGTCLTVTQFTDEEFTTGVSPETLRKTSLLGLQPGSRVNLERAVQPTTRMGGHFVQGHVDCTGEILSKEKEGDSLWIKVRVEDKKVLRYIVPKGFIAVDGTSLTVVDVDEEGGWFNFMLVAYTQGEVVIPGKEIGEKVNLEVDILGKYVERLLSCGVVESMAKKNQ
ncbi:Riboflavin synthase [Linum grandiflorum]